MFHEEPIHHRFDIDAADDGVLADELSLLRTATHVMASDAYVESMTQATGVSVGDIVGGADTLVMREEALLRTLRARGATITTGLTEDVSMEVFEQETGDVGTLLRRVRADLGGRSPGYVQSYLAINRLLPSIRPGQLSG